MPIKNNQISPLIKLKSDKKGVVIGTYPAEVIINQKTFIGRAKVSLDFFPNPGVYVYGRFNTTSHIEFFLTVLNVNDVSHFSINKQSVPGFSLKTNYLISSNTAEIKWRPKKEPVTIIGNESTTVRYIIFHIFNFKDITSDKNIPYIVAEAISSISRIELADKNWSIIINTLPSTHDTFKLLNEEGGYGLTHVGRIQRNDNNTFTIADTAFVLDALTYFLSFAKGCWCAPLCPVGINEKGRRVWESLCSPKERWLTPFSWFDPYQSSNLSRLFPLFFARWADDNWKDALKESIYWYLKANIPARGIDAGIILIQAALDRLAFEYSVIDKKLISAKGYKDLRTSDCLRMLFSSLSIPLEIPPELSALTNLASKQKLNWVDAPHAITEIRNALVHPDHKLRNDIRSVVFDAWNLGLWYIEMVILAICKYSGTYDNRLKFQSHNRTEKVPWAS